MKKKTIGMATAMLLVVATIIPVSAGTYKDNNCKASVTMGSTSARASITTSKVLYPTSQCTITTSRGTRMGNGTSYGSYSNVTVYRATSNEIMQSAIGKFTYNGSGGAILVNN